MPSSRSSSVASRVAQRRQHDRHPAGRPRSRAGRSSRAPSRRAAARRGGAASPARWARSSEVVTPISGRMSAIIGQSGGFGTWTVGQDSTARFATTVGFYASAAMSSQYIFTMYKLSPDAPAGQAGAEGHLAELPARAPRSACSASTARASRRCCGSWPGSDTEYRGEAQLAPGATVGLLEQEPQLDETKDVRGNVEDGVRRDARAARPLQRAGRQLLRRDRRRVRRACRSRSTPPTPGTSTRSSTRRWTRCACPPADADVTQALRRRAPPRRALPAAARARPTCCCSTSRPTTSTPSRSPGSSATSRTTRARRGRHPRSLLPRQRRRLDPRARPRPRPPVQGQLLELARAEAGAARAGGDARSPRASARSRPSSSGCARTPRAGARSPRRA